ncbi:hypothetical protein [Hoeflea sp. TYP-13]|uniref:hypothetical protein n=1 Tax=Hoeflea sp. TYP-13 TaxID=3230023 RepID=UPI0034C6773F
MKTLVAIIVAIAATAVALVGAATIWFFMVWDQASLRYRLTYKIDVNGEVHAGSGVIELTSEDTSNLPLPGVGFSSSAKGEAVVVYLGDGRYLFSLLNNASNLPFKPFVAYYKGNKTPVDVTRALRADKPSIELTSDQMPMLVTFANIDDPASVREVDPDDFAASFGPGVELESVMLEITDEPVTVGRVQGVLSWLQDPDVMENPGWSKLPLKSRRAIGKLLSHFPDLKG